MNLNLLNKMIKLTNDAKEGWTYIINTSAEENLREIEDLKQKL